FLAEATADITDADADLSDLMWSMWDRLGGERGGADERLFFAMSGGALQDGDDGARPLREQLIDPWLHSADALADRLGQPRAQARAGARLGVGVARGRLL